MAKRQRSTPEQRAVEGVLGTLWALVSLPFKNKGSKGLNPGSAATLSSHWGGVEDLLSNPATQALAVSEADKLLDSALQEMSFPGDRMADRLKAAEGHFGMELSNRIWRAHKLRNQLAHEVGTSLAPGEATVACRTFKEALRKLGVPL